MELLAPNLALIAKFLPQLLNLFLSAHASHLADINEPSLVLPYLCLAFFHLLHDLFATSLLCLSFLSRLLSNSQHMLNLSSLMLFLSLQEYLLIFEATDSVL
jgi:hypothetical protein